MIFLKVGVILFTIKVVFAGNITDSDYEIQHMLKDRLKDYNPMLRPNYLGAATEVTVDATILTVSNIDEVSMVYTIDMFLRQRWHDYRLAHNLNETLTLIMGTKEPSDIIWVPDTVFIDSVTSNMHHVTVNNHNLNINPDGSVFWGTRVTVSPSCPLNLKSYPMDKQTCQFEIVSYAYTSRHIKYKWIREPGIKINNLKMAQFALDDYGTTGSEVVYVAGSYWVLKGHFHFRRLIGPAVMQIYVPTIAVVIVSWISLWVNRSIVPARAALLITTLLTISAVWSSINAQLPRVNYVKAIDIFMMTSFGSVIMSLIEFTVVLNTDTIMKVLRRNKQPKDRPPVGLSESGRLWDDREDEMGVHVYCSDCKDKVSSTGCRHTGQLMHKGDLDKGDSIQFLHPGSREQIDESKDEKKENEKESEELADSIENSARLLFPVVYVVFLLFYFPYYLYQEQTEPTTS